MLKVQCETAIVHLITDVLYHVRSLDCASADHSRTLQPGASRGHHYVVVKRPIQV